MISNLIYGGAKGGATAPVNSVAPVISGTQKIGSTLSTTDGTWTGSPTYTYQWKRDGGSISLATNNTYILVTADDGTDITCVVTATNVGGSIPATSNTLQIRDFTTANGEQFDVLVTDSKGAYSFDTDQASPSPTAGTAFEYNLATNLYDALTSADLANAGTVGTHRGSPWPQYCIDLNTLTGKKIVISDSHSYGSTVYAATDTNTWLYGSSGGPYIKGTVYNNMITKTNALKAKSGVLRMRIHIILSINDISNVAAITDTTAGLDQLVTNLRTDLGTDWPIYISMVGLASGFPSTRFQAVRSKIIDLKDTYSNVWLDFNESLLYSEGLYDSVSSPLHFTQAGNNRIGSIKAKFVTSSSSDKDARRILTNAFSSYTAPQQSAISSFVSSMKSSGYWTLMDTIQIYRGADIKNLYQDFTSLTAAANGSFGLSGDSDVTFTANDRIGANGTNQHFQTRFAPILAKYAVINAGSSDFFAMVKTGTMTTTAGTLASIFGSTNNGRVTLFQDASSRTSMNLNNATPITYTTDTKLQSNTWYTIRTDGANAMLYKGATQVRTLAQVPSATVSTGLIDIFARNNANPDAPTERYNGEAFCFLFGRYTGVDLSTLQGYVDTLLTALA